MMITIIAISLLIVAGYLKFFVVQHIEQLTIQKASLQAKMIGLQSIKAVKLADSQLANQIIKQYSKFYEVEQAAILLVDESLLGFYTSQQGLPLPQMKISQLELQTEEQLIIAEPIFQSTTKIGYVYVIYDLKKLFSQQPAYLTFLLVLALFILLISFLLADYFQQWLTYPIRSMVRRITLIYQSGNFRKRLNSSKSDEIGRLSESFNQVLDAVERREKELTGRGKQLQQLVDVRTKQLFQKAHYDSLTGLPNRYLLVDRLKQTITRASRAKGNLALLFLDLDRFKVINDTFGHQNGDQLLKEVAKRLKKVSRDSDTVARLGGDEFVFLLDHLISKKDAVRSALRVLKCFEKPFKLQDHILHVSTSIGISIYPDDGEDDKTLLKNADISMYDAKKKGPGQFSYFSEEMNNTSLERLAIEANLRSAIEKKELRLVYQPQKNLKKNSFSNVEALIRWENEELGNVSPGVFIPIAEETGLIKEIDLWVISQSCKQIKIWNKQGLEHLTVAINVSAGHLISSTLLEHLKTEIIINDIKAAQIEIEITEEVFVEQTERTIENLKAIKGLGARIAIDDFGTGYSSLQYIQDFPADTLKLDGMFISKLETDKASQGIVRSTIILAHSLGLELVAECVEDQWQLDFLEKNGCDLIQGYFLAKPLPPEEIPAICK